ncbi:hypothetical protein [Moraxella lacunata]|uniref:hypothetical protein n=1 Tax=Moraxella lacunata TaxID=477 RepID=UPI003EE074F7
MVIGGQILTRCLSATCQYRDYPAIPFRRVTAIVANTQQILGCFLYKNLTTITLVIQTLF